MKKNYMKTKQFLLICVLFFLFGRPAMADDFHAFAPTPPMGWNSWDCYGPSVTEKQIYDNAIYMRDHLLEHGWNYVICDIRWYTNDTGFWYNQTNPVYSYDEYGRYTPNLSRFPSAKNGVGMKAIADSLHAMGLKFGIHIMRGVPKIAVQKKLPIEGSSYTCDQIYNKDSLCTWLSDNYTVDCTKPGAQAYYNSILNLYASWGVDFLKVDDLSRPYHEGEIGLLRHAIDQCGRDIVLSMSPGATPLNMARHCQEHANMWRMMDDLWDNWSDILKEFELCGNWNSHRIEGAYPDCDILPLGRIRITDTARDSKLTDDEQQTVMTLWSIFKSPLFFGGDLTYNTDKTLRLLTNDEVIDVNQHSVNNRELSNDGQAIVWATDAPSGGDKYAALFNIGTGDNWIRANKALYSTETISMLSTGYATDISVDIPEGSTLLALALDDAGDSYSYDHGDWINPTIHFADGSSRLLTKSDVISTNTGGSYYNYVNWNKNIEGSGKLCINGVQYDNGISAHANALILFSLPEGVVKFTALCGIDKTSTSQANATPTMKFMVFNLDPTSRFVNTDGAVANSGLVSRTQQAAGVTIEGELGGSSKLYLVVTDAGDGFSYDHADWINPTLIDYDGNETPLTNYAYTKASTDWKDIVNYGKNVDGGVLNVNGTTYSNGIGTNADAIIEYDLPEGKYARFRSFVGYDYDMKSAPSGVTMEFMVFTQDPRNDSLDVALDLTQLGIAANEECDIYDVWQQKTLGTYANSDFSVRLNAHASALLRVTPTGKTRIASPQTEAATRRNNGLADGIYAPNGAQISTTASNDLLPRGLSIVNEDGHSKKIIR